MPLTDNNKTASDDALVIQLEDASSGATVAVTAAKEVTTAPANSYSSYQPDTSNIIGSKSALATDASGRLETHTVVTSDEGSFRDDFPGSALTTTLTGTVTFTSGSTNVTGTGTAFTTQVQQYLFIKKTADSETLYVQVAEVISDTQLTLGAAYGGSTASTTAVVSNWQTSTGAGTSLSVASSILNLNSGTTSGSTISITRPGDYLPYTLRFFASVSQRIANQTIKIGFTDNFGTPGNQALIIFNGTNNTVVNFVTGASSAAADQQTTVATLPAGAVTSSVNLYQIDVSANQCTLSINGAVCAVNQLHIPGPYVPLLITAGITNSAAVTTTTLAIDSAYFTNWDRVQVDNDFNGEPMPVRIQQASAVSVSNVTVTTTAAVALPANAARRYFIVSCAGAAGCFIQFGNSPALVANNGIKLASGQWIQFDSAVYTGAVYAITASGTATLQVIEGT